MYCLFLNQVLHYKKLMVPTEKWFSERFRVEGQKVGSGEAGKLSPPEQLHAYWGMGTWMYIGYVPISGV